MKIKIGFFLILPVMLLLVGCYKQAPRASLSAPGDVRVVAMNAPAPHGNEVDLIVMTHIKKPSYLLNPRTPETPYTFTLSIDGAKFVETVTGREQTRSLSMDERGRGIHYVLKKRLRVKPGTYEISLKAEDGASARVTGKFRSGDIYTVRFDPVYGPRRFLRPKHFEKGLIDFSVNLSVRNFEEDELLD
ncbi:MAG: hypothetical protein ACE5DW_07405 [Thermodesulfobacteriota bacterium]